jgi:Inhibitor of Apoptosis domain
MDATQEALNEIGQSAHAIELSNIDPFVMDCQLDNNLDIVNIVNNYLQNPDEVTPPFKYRFEWERCLTFCKKNLAYTVREVQQAARYGFIWESTAEGQENGYLRCVFCNLELKRWDVKIPIAMTHYESSPFCPLLRNGMAENITHTYEDPYPGQIIPEIRMDGELMVVDDLMNSHLQRRGLLPKPQGELQYSPENFDKRFKTFQDDVRWHSVANMEDLAMYGFQYTGYRDRAECAFCGLSITYWKRGMLAAIEHRFWSPSCQFLNKSRWRKRRSTMHASPHWVQMQSTGVTTAP